MHRQVAVNSKINQNDQLLVFFSTYFIYKKVNGFKRVDNSPPANWDIWNDLVYIQFIWDIWNGLIYIIHLNYVSEFDGEERFSKTNFFKKYKKIIDILKKN